MSKYDYIWVQACLPLNMFSCISLLDLPPQQRGYRFSHIVTVASTYLIREAKSTLNKALQFLSLPPTSSVRRVPLKKKAFKLTN